VIERLQNYCQLIRIDKPIGILLLLWPTLIALLLATHGHLSAKLLFIFLAGTILTRSAGCVLNDIFDRKLDQHVLRTRLRPIASGDVSVREALLLCAFLLLLAFILVLLTNFTTICLALLAAVMMAVYPLMKRVTYLPQLWLGLTFNLGCLMAYTASGHTLTFSAWIIYLSAICSTMAYDTFYAMSDREEDLKVGIKSTAILFGRYDLRMILIFQCVSWALLLHISLLHWIGSWFDVGLGCAALCIIWQHATTQDREPDACFKAFLNHNVLWFVIFLGLLLNILSQ
jgi:4-hydroxybenzoate polyprenyltransferase